MRYKLFILSTIIIGLYACNTPSIGEDDIPADDGRTLQIQLKCDQFNNTTEWVYCEPIQYERILNAAYIILEVSMRNQRGTESVCQAELYNLTQGKPIPFTTVESLIDYEIHNVATDNIINYMDFEEADLAIRFRSTENNSTSYVSDNSVLVIRY